MPPKILFLDIETCPLEVLTWGIRDQYVGIEQIKKDWAALSWSTKWKGSSAIEYQDVRTRRDKRDDKAIMKAVHKLLSQADVVVAHNGDNFDLKRLNARFIKHELQPVKPFKSVDTLKIARKKFGFTSNKLEYLADFLGVARKSKHLKYPGLDLWKECMGNNQDAWREMEKYNKQDVITLEKVYDKLLAWDSSLNFAAFQEPGDQACGKCGSFDLQHRGTSKKLGGRFARYQCQSCGTWSQSGVNQSARGERQDIKRGIT